MRLWFGTAVIAGSQFIGTALGVAYGVLVARLLGPAGKGVLSTLINILMVASVAGNLGFYRSNLYYAGHQPEARARIATNSMVIAAALGTLTALLFFLSLTRWGGAVLGDIPPAQLAAMLVAVPFYFYNQYAQGLLIGVNALVPCQAVDLVGRFLLLVGTGVLTMGLHRDIEALVWFYTTIQALQSAIYAVVVRRQVGPSSSLFDATLFGTMVRYASRTYGAALLTFVLSRIDFFYVHWWSGDAAAGFYSVATQAVDFLSFVPLAMSAQLITHLAGRDDRDTAMTCQTARVLTLGMLALIAALALAAWPAIGLLYGPRFLPSVPPLWAVLPGALALGLQTLLAGDMAGRGYPMVLVWVWVPALAVSAIGLPLVVPTCGLVGAGFVTSAAYLTVCVLTVAYFMRTYSARLADLVPGPADVAWLLARLRDRKPSVQGPGASRSHL